MIARAFRSSLVLAALMIALAGTFAPARAVAQSNDQLKQFNIGYIGWKDDPRYTADRTEQRFQGEPWGRPLPGAQVAIDESRFQGISAGVSFALDQRLVANTQAVFNAVEQMLTQDTHFVLLDLPPGSVNHVAAHFQGKPVTFFNVSARDDRLRNHYCHANLLHTIASDAMRNDALAQYLVSRQWTKVLLLVGPRDDDTRLAGSFRRSAKRFGLDIVDTRDFVLGNDPRNRQKNNAKLITSGADYDIVYIADTEGEFSRDANYAIQRPRPVVGSAGLVAQVWHWSWRKYGARQLDHRFMRSAHRHITAFDYAAWLAVKAVVNSVQRTDNGDYDKLHAYLTSDKLALDSVKGYKTSFRAWDGQLRQPVLLASGNWVIARPPIKGFEHPTNYLDTLGFDPHESSCRMAGWKTADDAK